MSDADPRLTVLADKQEIAEVLYRYARGCDRADEAALRSCFHADSRHNHGLYEGLSHDFVDRAMAIVRPLKACKHIISNMLITVDGDAAVSECHYWAHHRRINEQTGREEDYYSGGRYLDRFERRDGAWKIASRTGISDFERYDAPSDRGMWQMPAEKIGAKHPDDPVYALEASLRGGK
ncbi:MAG: nuclear transport factor 2 family protein [Alphaproteobacteria bacterium]|nr:nuclear transport factor 2 family protein [Alphaproteobacteria bacterium]